MSSSDIFIGETIGTAVLVLLGGGVCAAVTLRRSKAHNAGWLAITFGWGFAVLTGAYIASGVSGAHLNPAVTIGLAIQGGTAWSDVPLYLASELFGAIIGAVLVWAVYYGQFHAHLTDPEVVKDQPAEEGMVDQTAAPKAGPVLGVFSTGPEIRNGVQNVVTEIIATFVLVLAILTQGLNDDGNGLGALGVLITALVVVGIGLSLGGPTGYAINPVRDLGPRIVHALLPLPNKGGSDWGYAWVPVVGPLIGAALAGGLYNLAFA
ncbi:aquaporin family protein [Streptomyces sp. FT05W]|uniref:Major intrinsic protein n=1 Tax=Streptomyces pratensis (strain ATCC 33331 / IAF-45CD) TaxID=591167 RepID=A0A8D3WQC3_STRFA|nr:MULTISPECIES: MIP/aquaporin family protein [Streptomyces]MBD2831204.1 aquaporin family protein [Streptomyces pratensis]MYT53941.1 aquaporin family protein [Streptomyces sp. SID7815]MYT61279.1 aquaporin family protein [Streptomyces sp. SID7834]RAS28113.1 glycerol uptake facilitator protein [Streptomyces avidinii]TPN21223.1 aquaporin family protein [Mesorhizobium sp. B2-3-3]SNX79406.1 glycerol uptake facilitator protein [Streptomyces microflavus]